MEAPFFLDHPCLLIIRLTHIHCFLTYRRDGDVAIIQLEAYMCGLYLDHGKVSEKIGNFICQDVWEPLNSNPYIPTQIY